jgi:LysM repeat protein
MVSKFSEPTADSVPSTERDRSWVPWLVVTAILLTIGWLLIGLYLYFRTAGPIVSGVQVGDTPVGGLTLEQAAVVIDNAWNRDRVLLVGNGDQVFEGKPLEFGLWVDPNATARKAYEYGRGKNHWAELLAAVRGSKPPDILPVVVFSSNVAANQLAYWGMLAEKTPGPAVIAFENGKWLARPGADGLAYDAESTLKALADNPALVLRSGFLPLITRPVASPVEELQRELDAMQAQLDKPLLVHAYDPITDDTLEWSVPREMLSSWLRPQWTDGNLSVSLDESGFGAYINSLEKELTDGRTFILPAVAYNLNERWQSGDAYTVIIRHPPTLYDVQAGDTLLKIAWQTGIPFWMILQANPGMDMDNMPAGQAINLPSKNDLIPLPVVVGKRLVLSITDQRLRVFENGSQIKEFVISTGIDRSPTQPGIFQVQIHELDAYASVWELYMPHFLGIYEAWPGFWNGFHGLPMLKNGTRLWGGILGKPASFGCIILKLDEAEWLYNWAENGVVVEITG